MKKAKNTPSIPIKLPKKELIQRLELKKVELQRQMHRMIAAYAGNTDTFWNTQQRCERIRERIYILQTRKPITT